MATQADNFQKDSWRALTYFNFYRFLIGFLFVSLYWMGQLPPPLGEYNRNIFAIAAHAYLGIAMCAQFAVRLRTPFYAIQVPVNVILDIAVITTLMYASAGLNSGFGMLLVIAVAGGSILSTGKIAILYASITTIAVLGHEVYMHLQQFGVEPNYTHAGFLGITFFATALISHALAKRVEVSEALAEERALDLENLATLNEHIVQRLQSGVVVLDDDLRVRLLNESAIQLLEIDNEQKSSSLKAISAELDFETREWLRNRSKQSTTLKPGKTKAEIQVSFIELELEKKLEILIFLEDVSTLRQRAQQMKLASLGRLTASIAHEIRNPLGAISHAGQLLKEEESITGENRRLTTIIDEQSQRVNSIIENILSISRREQATPIVIRLNDWLDTFIDEFQDRNNMVENELKIVSPSKTLFATMDPDQLYQILWNLCENGLRYSRRNPKLEIRYDVLNETERPYIDVIDTGSGMEKKVEDQIFEPFFTTSTKGTGLGLYIARELCEANQASLRLISNNESGCRFRIQFSHHEKQHSII